MREATVAMEGHLQGSSLTLCSCVRLSLRGGFSVGLTDFERDLSFDDGSGLLNYRAKSGYKRSSFQQSAGLDPNTFDFEFLLGDSFTEEDLRKGRLSGAKCSVFFLNYRNLSMGKIAMLTGFVSAVKPKEVSAVVQVNSLSEKLARQEALSLYSPGCRYDLGDSRCGVSLSSFPGNVSSVLSRRQFVSSSFVGSADPLFFNQGKLTFTSGPNTGAALEIQSFDSGTKTFTVGIPFPSGIQIGDSFIAQAGCDTSFSTCVRKFQNGKNFGGEPHVPGQRILKKFRPQQSGGYNTGGA